MKLTNPKQIQARIEELLNKYAVSHTLEKEDINELLYYKKSGYFPEITRIDGKNGFSIKYNWSDAAIKKDK